jgi:glyoxylase-like metal-dependent hydrolase (beta-lactamase superfamily II)
VAPGVRWLRMALPFALDHINLWLLRDRIDGRDGWTVVDCGIDDDDTTRAQWEQVFASQLEGLPVLRVIVTHMHPDHIGLAHWLTERWSTPGHECRCGSARPTTRRRAHGHAEHQRRWWRRGGRLLCAARADRPDAVEQGARTPQPLRSLVPGLPPRYRRLMDGQVLRIGGRTGLHRGPRPRARAHQPALRRPWAC